MKCEECEHFHNAKTEIYAEKEINNTTKLKEVFCEYELINHKGYSTPKFCSIEGYHFSDLCKLSTGQHIVLLTCLSTRQQIMKSPESKLYHIILRYLNLIAKSEDVTFVSQPSNDMQAYIIAETEPIGYLAFDNEEEIVKHKGKIYYNIPAIRQLFVIESKRRKGFGLELVKYFIDQECNTDAELQFVIESPNKKSMALLKKLEYVDNENKGINCAMVYYG